ncbi:hypothetical protein Q8A67_022041 [Cirrhinus molitorella]|uniref:Uncharacterized protein n=1 Tax=Cirrhinus molitorella TaxID=172907 RepID=A0AA88TNA8_9TELE|nr:hypothetical protein Q8A67_022041 [Cirrhinus molitorella]
MTGSRDRECWKLNTRKSFWSEGRLDRREGEAFISCALGVSGCAAKPLRDRGVLFSDTRGNHILHAALSILRTQRLRKDWRNKVLGSAKRRTVLLELNV